MTSLTEVYEGNAREVSNLRRLYAGTGFVLGGALFAVLAVVIGTTDFLGAYGPDQYGSLKIAGVLAGISVPAVLIGVFIVLPSNDRVRAVAAIGATLCVLGVVLFWHAYPDHWRGYGDDLTLFVSTVYLLGLFISVWSLFTAVVNFKTRNDPGGMLELNVTRRGRTKIVEIADSSGMGSIGWLGDTPDFNHSSGSPTGAIASSDGGASASDISSPLSTEASEESEIIKDREDVTDRYCGNCSSFRYLRSSKGIAPYCEYHDETMDDMDACDEWTPNRQTES